MRKLLNKSLFLVFLACSVISLGILAGLVFVIAQKGGPAITWKFLTEQILLVGASGGIFWNLVGTIILIGAAFLICTPAAVSLALVQEVWMKGKPLARWLNTILYTLNGVPSIVFGIFAFIVFVQWCNWGKSWLAGGIALAMSMLPTVTISLIERIRAIPSKYLEAAAGLGLKPSQIIWSVILPQSANGLFTGSLLALARAAGETAPIMFTATIFAGVTFPSAIKESPVLSLPYHIFILAQDSFDPAVGSKLWGSALVLLGLVFILSLLALPARLKIHEESHD